MCGRYVCMLEMYVCMADSWLYGRLQYGRWPDMYMCAVDMYVR